MAHQWLRLWHDMPNDPKWRTISRVSKQPITAVIAVYVHLLVIASNATERGRTQSLCSEDLASALDLDVDQIDQIMSAMQGRVLDGDMISGWSKRQVEREDGSAERAKRWREAKKQEERTQANASERKKTPDKDKDKEYISSSSGDDAETETPFDLWWKHYPRKVGKGASVKVWSKLKNHREVAEQIVNALNWQKRTEQWTKDGGQFIPHPATYLSQQRWLDEPPEAEKHPVSLEDYTKQRESALKAAREAYRAQEEAATVPVRKL